jgi:mono/diheme cytochrome c family protein
VHRAGGPLKSGGVRLLVFAVGVAGAAPPAAAQAGVYREGQADKGRAAFTKHCTSCHAAAAVIGLPFRRGWAGRSVFDFFEQLRTTMPNDSPGRLSRREYADIVAYVLKYNGLPPGERDLPDDDEGLKRIKLEFPPRSAP